MAKYLDEIIVVDVESTCWQGKPPVGMASDIIEIGICLLNVQTGEITKNQGIITLPERSTVSDFCTELTTITPEFVQENGIDFREACRILRKEYLSEKRAWASFGAYDLNQFKRQCTALDVRYPFGPSHINVKTLFALQHKLDRAVGMAGALKKLQIPLEGTHHRGVDDAKNIAKVLHRILEC